MIFQNLIIKAVNLLRVPIKTSFVSKNERKIQEQGGQQNIPQA